MIKTDSKALAKQTETKGGLLRAEWSICVTGIPCATSLWALVIGMEAASKR